MLEIRPRSSSLLGKHFTNWAISQSSEAVVGTDRYQCHDTRMKTRIQFCGFTSLLAPFHGLQEFNLVVQGRMASILPTEPSPWSYEAVLAWQPQSWVTTDHSMQFRFCSFRVYWDLILILCIGSSCMALNSIYFFNIVQLVRVCSLHMGLGMRSNLWPALWQKPWPTEPSCCPCFVWSYYSYLFFFE